MNGRYTEQLAFDIGEAKVAEAITAADLASFFKAFSLEGVRYQRFLQSTIKPMLERLEALTVQLPAQNLKSFDDMIGKNLEQLNDALGLGMKIRQRDYFALKGGGWAGS
jgi:serine/threonine-protein kinase HipA